MRSTGPGAARSLRALVAGLVLAAPVCVWLCTAPRASGDHAGRAPVGGVAGAPAPCHGGRDAPSPPQTEAPCSERAPCCGGCGASALVSTASLPADAGLGAPLASLLGVGPVLATVPLLMRAVEMRRDPPNVSHPALLATKTVVLRF